MDPEAGRVSANSAVIPHWHSPEKTPLTIVDGDGSRIVDDDGNEYLDFKSQLYCCNVGHGDEDIVDAMTEQARKIAYVSSGENNDTRSRLAAELGEIAPDPLSEVQFSISGSEANELAVQIARLVQDAPTVLTRWQSYHGGTYGAGSLTGNPGTRKTVGRYAETTGSAKFLPPLPGAFDADSPEDLAEQAANHVEYVIQNEGPDSVAAILMEPIAGSSGAYPGPPGYFERVRAICDEYDVLLIADEVITGFGRCGEWFGIQTEDVTPDMITFAKGVTSAYVPLAGVIVADWIGDEVREEGYGIGQTFAGHPVACAAGLATLEKYRAGLIDNVADLAPHLEDRLRSIEADYDVVDAVRGRGFLQGVVFADPETGEPFVNPLVEDAEDNPVAAVRAEAKDRGVLFGGGRPDVQIILGPPLCASHEEIDEAVNALEAGISTVFG